MENFETLLILMVVIWLFGKLFRALKLPVIFGELLGGIVVGPMALGLVDAEDHTIELLAEFGIFFLMLHAGLESDPNKLFKASKKSFLVAIGGVVVPFILGYVVTIMFGRSFEEALFVALGLSCTAIAISIRLFKDYKIQATKTAQIVLGAAVISDIIALILFSVILDIVKTGNIELGSLTLLLSKVVLFFVTVIFVGYKTEKHLPKIFKKKGFTFTLIASLTLGLLAEAIGLHAIIGAFLAGLFIRQEILDDKIFNKIEDRIYGLSYSFLGPIFFASLAFHLDFTAIAEATWFLISIIFVATIGKFIGAGGAAYLQKIKPKRAATIGLAMNSRGAVELIIASIGLQTGVISETVFSALIVMAFATTLTTIFSMKYLAKYA